MVFILITSNVLKSKKIVFACLYTFEVLINKRFDNFISLVSESLVAVVMVEYVVCVCVCVRVCVCVSI